MSSSSPQPIVTEADQTILEISNVTKIFQGRTGPIHVFEDFSLSIQRGEFVSIVGPSGCGKSTLLNLNVGLIPPTSGAIRFHGKETQGVNTALGYVTQDDNLMPWRTLIRNVEFGMEVRGVPKDERRRRAQELIDQVGLNSFEHSYPHELSGGMRQRANVIRTLAYNPEVILLDEPFGALDAQTRLVLQDQLLQLWDKERKTIVFITHDVVEAIALADRVVILTARPAHVKAIKEVSIPRPRDVFRIQKEEKFRDVFDEVWDQLSEELVRGGIIQGK